MNPHFGLAFFESGVDVDRAGRLAKNTHHLIGILPEFREIWTSNDEDDVIVHKAAAGKVGRHGDRRMHILVLTKPVASDLHELLLSLFALLHRDQLKENRRAVDSLLLVAAD